MNSNENISTEVKLYREIQTLCTSAEEKMQEHFGQDIKKNGDDEVWNMLVKAREAWEAKHERTSIGFVTNSHQPETIEQTKKQTTRRLLWPYLVAALLIGIISFVTIRYLQKRAASPSISMQPNQQHRNTVISLQKDSSLTITTTISDSSIKNNQLLSKTSKPINKDELFTSYFKPDAVPLTNDVTIQEPFDFYKQKNYNDAIETFEMAKATLDTRSETDEKSKMPFYIHYYLGLSYMAAGKQFQKAITELKAAVQNSKDVTLQSKAKWYLALAYLKKGNTEETKKTLNQILTNNTTTYQQKATHLLKQLNGS